MRGTRRLESQRRGPIRAAVSARYESYAGLDLKRDQEMDNCAEGRGSESTFRTRLPSSVKSGARALLALSRAAQKRRADLSGLALRIEEACALSES